MRVRASATATRNPLGFKFTLNELITYFATILLA
jgi:hypothetical protein